MLRRSGAAAAMSERARRRQLGRGLAALFGEAEGGSPADPAPQRRVPIELIRPGAFQPRRRFAEAELDALAQSIREKGILQPLLVRPLAGEEAAFELVAGERRWRAAQRVGLHEVPVIVRALADSEALEIALVENLQREDLSPLEEAEAYSRLMEEFGRTQASLAEAVGKSRSHVANTLRLLSLPAPVRRRLDEGELVGRACPRAARRAGPGGARRGGRAPRAQRPRHRAARPAPLPQAAPEAAPARRRHAWRSSASSAPRSGCASPSRRKSAAAR